MTVYDDNSNKLTEILNSIVKTLPLISEFVTDDNEKYTFWQITDPQRIEAIQNSIQGPLYIADGHHRYETSLNYQNEENASGNLSTAINYIMASVTPIQDPGLVSLPYHRMLQNLSQDQVNRILRQINVFFESRAFNINGKSKEAIYELIEGEIYQTPDATIGFIDDSMDEL